VFSFREERDSTSSSNALSGPKKTMTLLGSSPVSVGRF
jgi:hypothetical protein